MFCFTPASPSLFTLFTYFFVCKHITLCHILLAAEGLDKCIYFIPQRKTWKTLKLNNLTICIMIIWFCRFVCYCYKAKMALCNKILSEHLNGICLNYRIKQFPIPVCNFGSAFRFTLIIIFLREITIEYKS